MYGKSSVYTSLSTLCQFSKIVAFPCFCRRTGGSYRISSYRSQTLFISQFDKYEEPMISPFRFILSATLSLLAIGVTITLPNAVDAQKSGKLIVELKAEDVSDSSENWLNRGSLGDFHKLGAPKRAIIGTVVESPSMARTTLIEVHSQARHWREPRRERSRFGLTIQASIRKRRR